MLRNVLAAVGALSLLPSVAAAQGVTEMTSAYQQLTIVDLLAVELGVLLFVGISLFALFPDWGKQAVRTARRSPFISFAVGIPGILALLVVAIVAGVLSAFLLTMIVGLPLLVTALAFALVWRAVGFIAVGTFVAARVGRDNHWVGLFVGAVINTAFLLVPLLGPALNVAVLILGIGAGLRVMFGSGGVSKPSDRNVPPAHRT